MATNFSAIRLLAIYCALLVLAIPPIAGAALQQCLNEQCGERKEGIRSLRDFSDLKSDFENGWPNSKWIDESEGGFQWSLEDYDNPTSWEKDKPAPRPPDNSNGKKYIRVHREASSSNLSTFGVAILRSQTFSLPPEDVQFSFSFWIRSKWAEFNNLEVQFNSCSYDHIYIYT